MRYMANKLVEEQNRVVAPSNLEKVLANVRARQEIIGNYYWKIDYDDWVDWDYYVDTYDDWNDSPSWYNSSYTLSGKINSIDVYYKQLSEAFRLLYK